MLTVAEALAAILEHAQPTPTVRVPAARSLGSVLAEEIVSDVDSPPHDKATVDGYAVVAADLASGLAELEVIEEITAGEIANRPLGQGQTSRVMTGAPIPAGASAMVMIERSESLPASAGAAERVRLTQSDVRAGQNIVRRAASLARGDVVLRPGVLLRPSELGLLAEVGRTDVLVHRRPSLAVLATGNELVDAALTPAAGQIRNSNGPLLAAAAELAGADVVALGIARDDPAELADRIQQGLTCDALVIAGGVSAGRLDLVPAALRTAGVQQVFHKVSLKPGKPLWFGVRHGAGRPTLVFGLPGNPVSSRVCFELFVRPALERVRGAMPTGTPRLAARLGCSFQHVGDRPTYYPGRWQSVGGDLSSPAGSPSPPWVAPLSWHGSGDLHALSQASVLIHFPAGEHVYAAGDLVEVLLFNL